MNDGIGSHITVHNRRDPRVAPASRSHKRSWFEEFFLHHGAGAHLFKPLKQLKYWNALLWILIVLGIAAWIALFIFLNPPAD